MISDFYIKIPCVPSFLCGPSNHNSSSSTSFMAGSGRGVCAASAAATTSRLVENPASRFSRESSPCRLALCFFIGLPIKLSSVRLFPNTLFGKVKPLLSPSVAGVALPDVLLAELGDLPELVFKIPAECWRFNWNQY